MSDIFRRIPGMTLFNLSDGYTRYVGETGGKAHEVAFTPDGGWEVYEMVPAADPDGEAGDVLIAAGGAADEPVMRGVLAELGYATEGQR